MPTGTVTKSTGSWYNVRLDDTGEMLQCRIVGKFRLDDVPLTNPVAVGDRVEVHREGVSDAEGMINKILPRRNFVVRQSPRRKHDLHLLAANIDQAVLIVTVVQPNLKPGFIDRFLLMTEPHEIPVTIVFNKGDLYTDDDVALFFSMKEVYEKIGYRVIATSGGGQQRPRHPPRHFKRQNHTDQRAIRRREKQPDQRHPAPARTAHGRHQ